MDPIRILEPDGTLVGDAPIGLDETRRLYDAMLVARTYDHKSTAMQKQGRLATYAPFEGQELPATQDFQELFAPLVDIATNAWRLKVRIWHLLR